MDQMLHVSTEIVRLPMSAPLPDQEQFNRAIERGLIRDVKPMTLVNGEAVRVGRTKGVTYRRSEPKIRHGQGRIRRGLA